MPAGWYWTVMYTARSSKGLCSPLSSPLVFHDGCPKSPIQTCSYCYPSFPGARLPSKCFQFQVPHTHTVRSLTHTPDIPSLPQMPYNLPEILSIVFQASKRLSKANFVHRHLPDLSLCRLGCLHTHKQMRKYTHPQIHLHTNTHT